GRAGGGTAAGAGVGGGAGAGGRVTVPVRVVPTWRNSTGCRNAVATATPCRFAGANCNAVEPATAAESSAGKPLASATRVDSGMSLPVESTNSRSVTSPSTFRSNSAGGYAIGASGLSATGASDSGGGAAWLVCPSGCRDPPRHAVSTNVTSNIDRTSGASIFAALLPRREPVQGVERRQRVDVEAIELEQQRIRRRREQGKLRGIERRWRPLPRHMMTRFQQF